MSEDARRLVGQNVRRLRLAAKISQAELAARMGVDRAYVSGLEQGNRNPTVITLWHLAKALQVSIASFFEERAKKSR
jgi:transcriptional regulator with XRE-family HTH domain